MKKKALSALLAALMLIALTACSVSSTSTSTTTVTTRKTDENGNITMMGGCTNDPDGKIAKENAERKAEEERKALEEAKAAEVQRLAEEQQRREEEARLLSEKQREAFISIVPALSLPASGKTFTVESGTSFPVPYSNTVYSYDECDNIEVDVPFA